MDPSEFEHYQMQEAMQSGQIEAQQAQYAPQMLEQAQQGQAILVQQTDPKRIVREIVLRLRGMEERPDGTLVQVAAEKLNKVGQDNVWFWLDSHINQNIILSSLKDTEITKIMASLQVDLVDDLSLNWKEYGIKKKTDLDTINDSVLINIFLAMKRAQNQNEKNWLRTITTENVSGASRLPNLKKDSWWKKFALG